MVHYGVVWHPATDNLGDDLQALAAMRLMPRVEHVLDGENLHAPIPGVKDGDRVVTLLSGNVYRRCDHWPPEKHIVPVCVGMHFSKESVWGVPLTELDGAGLHWLKSFAPIGCRDKSTRDMLYSMGLPVEMNGCVTLTLKSSRKEPRGNYICCVDVPDEVVDVLTQAVKPHGIEVRRMTHQNRSFEADFERRMEHAQWMVDAYAGAQLVVTRRLHAAMAGVAVDTPTLLLYHASYESVESFAPMDGMINSMPVEDYIEKIRQGGWQQPEPNPDAVSEWRKRIRHFIASAMERAETCPMSPVTDEEAAQWRLAMLTRMAERAETKIRRLELDNYTALHEKFSLLMREDHVRASVGELLEEKPVQQALRHIARMRKVRILPWYKRPAAYVRLAAGKDECQDPVAAVREELGTIGWPVGEDA